MKATAIGILTVILIAFFIGCGQAHEDASEDRMSAPQSASIAMEGEANGGAMAPMTSADTSGIPVSSSAAVETGKDSVRKFIRTADLRFKVKNVVTTTYQIEDIVSRFGGFVTDTRLNSNINRQTTVAISADSSLETTYYTVVNTMTLRVPNTKLDSTLKAIAPLVDFLDHRFVSASDISLSLLANRLTQQRIGKHEARLKNAIDRRGRKIEETTTAEENVLNKLEQADNATIENLSLLDQVQYSTVSLYIYQRESFNREVIPNDRNIEEYEPGPIAKLLEALENGWAGLVAVVVFLTRFWALFVAGIVAYVLYRKFAQRS